MAADTSAATADGLVTKSGRYRTIVADPPWPMPTGGPRGGTRVWNPGVPSSLPYATMTLDEIAALPVSDLAERHAHLYVWTVNAFLDPTYDLVRGWGFKPSQVLVWAKTPRGLGMGGAFTNTTEFIVFAWRGSLSPRSRVETSWWNWQRGGHSEKPEAFLDLVEQVSPGPYLEMFSRRARLGWQTWGDQALHGTELCRMNTFGESLPPAGGWKRHMREDDGVEYQFWTTDNDGRELLAAVATNRADATVLWDGIIRARACVEWRESRNGEYKGRLVRGWDGDAAPADRLYHGSRDA